MLRQKTVCSLQMRRCIRLDCMSRPGGVRADSPAYHSAVSGADGKCSRCYRDIRSCRHVYHRTHSHFARHTHHRDPTARNADPALDC
jgi:hypothetical protein